MSIDADIIEYVRTNFSDSDTVILDINASRQTGRVARCIVVASSGSLQKLREYIQMAETDFRDVIVAGEYDGTMRQIRDLCVSFLIASPEDFWIAETAESIYKRGYILTALKSLPATVGPFDYICDRSEGTATFSNQVYRINVIKTGRIWSVKSDDDLRRFGLDEAFDNEERFRKQLDFYLSQKL